MIETKKKYQTKLINLNNFELMMIKRFLRNIFKIF